MLYLLRYEREEIIGIFDSQEKAELEAMRLFSMMPDELNTPVFGRPRLWSDDFWITPMMVNIPCSYPHILQED